MPSPIHRDPEVDGDGYGCFTDEANAAVAELVQEVIEKIDTLELTDGDAVVKFVKPRLKAVRNGATDTVVKENVFQALDEAMTQNGIRVEAMDLYGW